MIVKGKATYEDALDIPEGTCGAFRVEHIKYPAGHKFPLATNRTIFIGGQPGGVVEFDHSTTWRVLKEGDASVWMSDYPIEQAQHDRELKQFRGRSILVGGLGLGYAATVLALKLDVARVTVVERSVEVIKLVAGHLLRGDRRAASKVEVVNADLFEYLGNLPAGKPSHDMAFYDIWASDGEGTFFGTVIPLLRLSRGRVRSLPVCWNEDVMRGQLYFGLQSRWMVTGSGEPQSRPGRPTLDELCEEKGSVWVDWSAPFFRWLRKTKPPKEDFDRLARLYAGAYGRPSFGSTWQVITGEPMPDLDFAALRKLDA